MALITAAEARDLLPGLTGTGEDTLLGTLIDSVGALFARVCGYPPATVGAAPTMESASYTLYVDAPCLESTALLDIGVRPVTAVANMYVDISRVYGADTEITEGTDFEILGEEGQLLLITTGSGAWATGLRANKIVCTAGFATVRDDLKHACKVAVKDLWELRSRQGVASRSRGGSTFSARDEQIVRDIARELLTHYRLADTWLA